jgi:thioredoxin reductase
MLDPTAIYDVVIVGGGPGGLSAALALGRARRRVLLCDAGPRRNAAAVHMHNFVTRDGTPPDEFRRLAREQLATYPNVEVRDAGVEAITGTRGAFDVRLSSGPVRARRILLCVGMIDELLPIEGFGALWGHAIFQCPYCHGWEVRDRPWGFLASAAHPDQLLPFAFQLRAWTGDLVVFTGGAIAVPDETRAMLASAGIRLETAPVTRLVGAGDRLAAIELADGRRVARGLALDDDGYVKVDPMKLETSVPGIYAAGDLTTRMQGAMIAAALGTRAAAAMNVDVMMELASTGALGAA